MNAELGKVLFEADFTLSHSCIKISALEIASCAISFSDKDFPFLSVFTINSPLRIHHIG